jgi:hypothetical protein
MQKIAVHLRIYKNIRETKVCKVMILGLVVESYVIGFYVKW